MKRFKAASICATSIVVAVFSCAAPSLVNAVQIDPNFVTACLSSEGVIRVIDTTTSCQSGDILVQLPTKTSVDALPSSFISYAGRAKFTAAAGPTTTSDFGALPAGDNYNDSYNLSGVTFNNFHAYWNIAAYIWPGERALKVDLPPGTRAIGADLSSFYGDPGTLTMVLSTGQEITNTYGKTEGPWEQAFMGVVSAKPIEWVKFNFSSVCLPKTIYGVATCPGFPDGYAAGILYLKNFTYGPGL